ncbi:hypothetical protein L1F30_16475 [Simiduia sp. 21SJ11W-1]|uniref:hypothetical protein n=1 Tax=Simiduia sp. 21SJ11W-1 TaxID=2909669 RepID=UPI0020A0C1B0|nr:hypothetical protein [Simiduia sp. 21SJ11W-1]UTA47738.1 hypothetical protein L1F30_16475 [Simiduia sp. 21SJ11W-1]
MATAKNMNSISSQEKLAQAYHLAGEAAADAVGNVKEQAKATLEANKERATEVADKAESVIKERPLLSVGCAFVAGWAISKLLK